MPGALTWPWAREGVSPAFLLSNIYLPSVCLEGWRGRASAITVEHPQPFTLRFDNKEPFR